MVGLINILYRAKITTKNEGIFGRIKYKIFDKLFDVLKGNVTKIKSEIEGYTLLMPIDHKLPFLLKDSKFYSRNVARIAKLVKDKYEDLKIIDVGANIGDTVALIRNKVDSPILCIEGSEYFFEYLEINSEQFDNIYLEKAYLGDKSQELLISNAEMDGTGHINVDYGASSRLASVRLLSEVLNKHSFFYGSKFFKIDTDGFDNKIIRGAEKYIKKSKPVIFFEYDPFFLKKQNENEISIFNYLHELGYKKILIYENYGELLLSADIFNKMLLEDITSYLKERGGLIYCDICAFHAEDNDLFEKIRTSEQDFFESERRIKY